MRQLLNASLILGIAGLLIAPASADVPTALARGEAPLLFSAAEGEGGDATLLLDGQAARGDDIWLWMPAVNGGQVDLGATGQFFKVWDSGPVLGPDGNDDDRNGMRGLDFNPSNGKFLISYEDTTTTGFAFGNILDGDLMEMTPTSISNGFITGHSFNRWFSEGANGVAGNIGTGDISAISSLSDGTLLVGLGGSQTIQTDGGGTLSVGSSTLAHLDPFHASGSPANVGPNKYFEASVAVSIIFPPAIYTGALRGADLLDSGELTFGTSGDYANTDFLGPIDGLTDAEAAALAIGVTTIGNKSDIFALPDYFNLIKNTYQQRTAEVLYDGSLFFQSPGVGNAEILDYDVLSLGEIQALISLLGADSDAGLALSVFVPEPGTLGMLAIGCLFTLRRRR